MTPIPIQSNIKRRILAGLIDYFIIYSLTFTLIFTIGEPNNDGELSLKGAQVLLPMVLWFLLTVGLESGLGGTIGNTIMGLKAIPKSEQNRKLSIVQSFKRHLLDPFDMFFFGLPGIITIRNTYKHQRIGDLWAKTIVVKIKDLK